MEQSVKNVPIHKNNSQRFLRLFKKKPKKAYKIVRFYQSQSREHSTRVDEDAGVCVCVC